MLWLDAARYLLALGTIYSTYYGIQIEDGQTGYVLAGKSPRCIT